jgi:hypothetical protein
VNPRNWTHTKFDQFHLFTQRICTIHLFHASHGMEKSTSDNSKQSRTPKGGEGLVFQFLHGEGVDDFLEWLCVDPHKTRPCWSSQYLLHSLYYIWHVSISLLLHNVCRLPWKLWMNHYM